MKLIYVGAHPRVSLPWGGTAVREGVPVEVDGDIAKGLIACNNFIEYKPEPAAKPVQTVKE